MHTPIKLKLMNIREMNEQRTLFTGFNLSVKTGELLVLLGKSHNDKTALLKFIAGFEKLEDGAIYIDNDYINNKKTHERNIAIILEEASLFPRMTVAQNIGAPLIARKLKKKEQQKKIDEVLALLGITGIKDCMVEDIKKEQTFLVSLARAIVYHPSVVLLDRPLEIYSEKIKQFLQQEIKRVQKATGITMLYTTDHASEALVMGDRVAILGNKELQQLDTPQNLASYPENYYVATYMNCQNILRGVIKKKTQIEKGYALSVDIGAEDLLEVHISKEQNRILVEDIYIILQPDTINCVETPSENKTVIKGKVTEIRNLEDKAQVQLTFAQDKRVTIVIRVEEAKKLTVGNMSLFEVGCEMPWVMYETEKGKLIE